MSLAPRRNSGLDGDESRLKKAYLPVVIFVALLWLIRITESLFGWNLVSLGVYPRRIKGLIGILCAPLIHSSWSHLFANTAPLLVLGTALRYGYPRATRVFLPALYVGTGLAVWLFGRPAFHVGASGLTFGAMFFIFTSGILRWERRAIALSMMVFFLYGSMIWGIFPLDPSISFETHFFGALIGVALAFVLKKFDPPEPRQRYSWEEDEQRRETKPTAE